MANPFIQQQDPEELAILRRQRMAEQLMQQAQQPMEQGQMAGRIYVAPSWTQYLAKGLQQYMGARGVQQADEEAKALYEGRQAQTQAERQKFAELLRPTPAITLPSDQQGPVAPEQPGDLNAATMLAMQSRDPALQSFAFNSLANQPALAEARATRAEDRAFRAQEFELARQARMEELKARLADAAISRAERIAADKELKAMILAGQQGNRQPQIVDTPEGKMEIKRAADGSTIAVPVLGPEGKPIAGMPRGGNALSATAQKEVFEADDAILAGSSALDSLNKALAINDAAYSGPTALLRAQGMSMVQSTPEADATINFNNIIQEQALTSMKSIFGGNPTEGERAILLELQASVQKTPKQRKDIIDRAKAAAERRIKFNQDKANRLREGTYMSPGGAPAPSGNGASGSWDNQPPEGAVREKAPR
jgi:hypothetical protein